MTFLTIARSLAVAGSLLTATSPVLGDHWPRFRGPNGTGISADKNVPVAWTEKDGILWKTALPGAGNSSPVVWGSRIFLQSATPDGKERSLVCLSTDDGRVLWSRTIPGSRAHIHSRNTLASSTPATDGQRVYAVVWDGKVVRICAYDLEGKPLWNSDLGGFTSQHGVGMSPIVAGDKVIVANDQDGTSTLVALGANSGKIAWQNPRKAFRACYSTPFTFERPNAPAQLVVASTAGITIYSLETGAEIWNWNWTFSGMPLRTVASPIFHRGMILANGGDGNGDRHTVAVKLGEDGSAAAQLAWEKHRGFPYVPTMLAFDGHLFFVNDSGIAHCSVATTGDNVWAERLGDKVSASPILVDDKIYVIDESGTAFVLAASTTFRLLATSTIGESVIATPAVADGRLYIRGKEHLFCIGRAAHRSTP
jgi:outer membrane protein assembly factor BamB